MISKMLVDSIRKLNQEVENEQLSQSVRNPKKLNDSIDESDNFSEIHQIDKYNYSPKYNIIIEKENFLLKSERIEERKSEIEINDEITDSEDESADLRMRHYDIDTSKIVQKMDDFGKSPYKLSTRSIKETDAICIH
jgi:hypothetical protein